MHFDSPGSPSSVESSSNRWFLLTVVLLGLIIGYSFGTMHAKIDDRIPKNDTVNTEPTANSASSEEWSDSNSSGDSHVDLAPDLNANDHVRGDRNAPIVMIEYADLECPYCRQVHPTMQQLMKDYPGKVMWVYRYYPLDFHQHAQAAAETAECVYTIGGNDKFWAFVDTVFANSEKTPLDATSLNAWAIQSGVSQSALTACLQAGKSTQTVKDEQKAADDVGVRGTPAIYLVNQQTKDWEFVDGAQPITNFKDYIDGLLSGKSSSN